MQPLFQFVNNSTAYIPWIGTNDDGSPVPADGVRYFDLDQAAARSGHSREDLLEAWRTTFAQFTGEVLDLSPADSDKLRMRDAYLERALRGLTPEQAEDVRVQAEAMGYDLTKDNCWATVVEDEAGNKRGVCVAKLSLLQERVLKSGKFNGRRGPVEFRSSDGPWVDIWTDGINPPHACRMTLCRKDLDEGFEVSGLWAEMKTNNWYFDKRPTEAMEKCVEAKGLRKLFRDVLGDIYIPEELPGRGGASGKRRGPRPDEPKGPRLVRDSDDGSDAPAPREPGKFTNVEQLREAMRLLNMPPGLIDSMISEARANLAANDQEAYESDHAKDFYGAIYADAARKFGRFRGSR